MNSKGFTLVELLVAVGIIGVLASVSVVSVNSVRLKARDSKRVSDVKTLTTGLEQYASDNAGRYPSVEGTIGAGNLLTLCNSAAGFEAGADCANNTTRYMAKVNPDPGNNALTYTALPNNCTNAADAPCTDYSIAFTLEGISGSLPAGVRSATPSGIR